MFKKTLRDIYKLVAEKNGVSIEEVEEIVTAQFMLVRKTMNEGIKNEPESFKGIQLTHLGKFAVRTSKLEEFKNKANGEES